MPQIFEDRLSDSPFVDRIWRTQSGRTDPLVDQVTSITASRLMMVIWKQYGKTYVELRGPETKVTHAPVPEEAEFLGVIFKLGSFMPAFPLPTLIDREVMLPDASSRKFWLDSAACETPTYDNIDTFLDRLVRQGLLVRDPVAEAVLKHEVSDVSIRTAQRHFLKATGLSQVAVRQIERARYATTLLLQGTSIVDTTFQAGYFDQPHMTHALKRLIGQTPAQIMDRAGSQQLSYIYKTTPFW
jgi:hypothetical protein